ncbi:preprotein translocase subunit SecY [Candidatus Absconditicoccus praedator]|uniref:preprotein translocase subunit SecY n=1 Tax=Candidatus Absconditicoccus praedator TaxID=2735562 RepID=UPI001E4388E4|nr:preprotein translocase subunit SecY [Candidatus Absconditicoccus praedator]UFX82770.1 preprotein translocase subunit SecY [Candidatus Absconditicoccus praedator]
MFKILNYLQQIRESPTVRRKLLFMVAILALYRLMVFVPVPFVDVDTFMMATMDDAGGLEFFAMLLGGTIEQFSIVAVGLIPFINASIIMQLLAAVVPQLEELKEQGETGQMKIQQYTRYLTLPLAFVQAIGMIFFINNILGGDVIQTTVGNVILAAFAMSVGTMILMWFGEMITEKGMANGISLLIFSSIVAGMTSQVYNYIGQAGADIVGIIVFMFLLVLILVILAILLVKTKKDIPIVYSRQGNVEDTASLPIPLNPVGMIPIIFAIAFASFPYLLSQLMVRVGTQNEFVQASASWIETHLNIYTQQPSVIAIIVYFLLIVAFTFFYTIIVFNPDRMADNIQKRGGFIPGIRPGEETAKYINQTLYHLCFWGGIGLGLIGIYSYVLSYIPFIQQATQSVGAIPVVVSGAGIIIIVNVVVDIINRLNSQLAMEKYDKI